MGLISVADLEQALGVTLAGADIDRAQQLIDDASAAVIAYTGQTFLEGTSTVLVDCRRGFARLGQWPVRSISSVTNVNDTPVPYRWEGGDRVWVTGQPYDNFAFEPSRFPARVKVTYEHGSATAPDDIRAVVRGVAGRAFGVNPQDTALSQETVGSYNYSLGAAAASGAIGFMLPERAILDRYVRHLGSFGATR